MADPVSIYEVGPRDGLQNEARAIPTGAKIALVDALSRAGFAKIEVASFVHPKLVPQMADGAEVLDGIARAPGVRYAALTPNLKGLERALEARADEVAVFGSASEGFSQANINCSVAESIERFRPVVAAGLEAGLPVRGYVSCVTDCPYDGPTPPGAVAHVAGMLAEIGCYQISLGDTIGAAVPATTGAMLTAVTDAVPADRLAGHFHDTHGRALDNIAVCLEAGLRVFDGAVGGLGGCPFAPGAAGNVATGAVVEFMEARGMATGIDADALARAAALAREMRG